MIKLPLRAWRHVTDRFWLLASATSADGFLASFPKSGRTWFRFILANYFDTAAGLGVGVDLHKMFSVVPNFDRNPIRGVAAFHFQGRQPHVPLILVTHHGYRRSLFLGRPVIFMVRDPRDIMVSAYFHATRHKNRYCGTISDFLRDSQQGLPLLIRYLNGWAAGLRNHSHFILSYETLSTDPATATAKVLTFLGCGIDAAALRQAVEASRFEAMRNHEKIEGIPAHCYDREDQESMRMRRGKVGGFTDYLRPSDVVAIETICNTRLTPAAKMLLAGVGMQLD